METHKAANGRTAAVIALAAVVAVAGLAVSADSALARGGRGGYTQFAGCAWYGTTWTGTGPYCPTGTGPLRLQLAGAARGAQGPAAVRGGRARVGQRPVVAALRAERALRAVENARVKRLLEELRPDQEQRVLIREAYGRGLERRHELLRERAALLDRMRDEVRPARPARGPLSKASEQEIREMVQGYRQVERELAQTAWDTEDRIFERLSPAQKLRYIILNERFDLELRQRIGALRQRGSGLGPAQMPPAQMPPAPEGDLPDDPGK